MESYLSPAGRAVPARAVRFSYARSGGPGGQHVNTSATKVRVTLQVEYLGLDDETRARVEQHCGGEISVVDQSSRSQHRNRGAALARALSQLDEAAAVPVDRIPTTTSAAAHARRLQDKRHHSRQKALRRAQLD
jgi:ribosome-associated protein